MNLEPWAQDKGGESPPLLLKKDSFLREPKWHFWCSSSLLHALRPLPHFCVCEAHPHPGPRSSALLAPLVQKTGLDAQTVVYPPAGPQSLKDDHSNSSPDREHGGIWGPNVSAFLGGSPAEWQLKINWHEMGSPKSSRINWVKNSI